MDFRENIETPAHKDTVLELSSLQRLRTHLQGEALLPGDGGYDRARKAWVPTFEQHPALIVLPTCSADVVAAVTFAREQDLPIAVQGGGHGHPYPADGALLINFEKMNTIQINPETSTARVEAGLKWGKVIETAHQFGLAPLNGFASTVGVVGYLVGGGIGWLTRQYGTGAASIRSVELVTANGELLHIDQQRHPDLFWGLRGGGGNFGVVTAIEIALYPVKEVFGGQVIYPVELGKEAITAYLNWVKTVPVELTSAIRIMNFPELPFLPPIMSGKTIVLIAACYNGAAADGEEWLRPMRTLGTPLLDTFTQLPYARVATIANDPEESPPHYYYTYHMPMQDLTTSDIEEIFDIAASHSSGILQFEIRHLGGALASVSEDAMAISLRDVNFSVFMMATAPEASMLEISARSMEKIMQILKPNASVQAIYNFLEDNDVSFERTRAAFTPENYRRLVALKDKYDPGNVFRFNNNIPPSREEMRTLPRIN